MSALLIAAHEIRRQWVQPFVWILAGVLVALMAWQFLLAVGAYLQVSPRLGAMPTAPGVTDLVAIPLLRSLSTVLLVIVPLLTMRSFAGERRDHSLVLLLAAGVGDTRIVLGKFLGTLAIVFTLIALVAILPFLLRFGATIDIGKLMAAMLGVMFWTCALTAIGLACSAATSQPALAAAAAFIVSLLLGIVDLGARLEGADRGAINYLAMPTHLEPFLRGIVASVDIIYFVLLAGVALWFAVARLGALRRIA
ncbi:MAG: ABC transporter permease [Dokdonella sp.]